jgi:hypothetical protein
MPDVAEGHSGHERSAKADPRPAIIGLLNPYIWRLSSDDKTPIIYTIIFNF